MEALSERRVETSEATEAYLVELLAAFVGRARRAPCLSETLVQQLQAAVEADGLERLRRFRALGDHALYVSGFFRDHLEHRGLSLGYVAAMGRRGYAAAGDLASFAVAEAPRGPVYAELAAGFDRFVGVLDEVREGTDLRTPQDLVALFDRWRRTRSPRLAARLREEGVVPTWTPERGLLH
ncbi:MAG: hypothetical protein ACFCGT_13820 [Sandaracinaceae bacterium]